MESCRLRRALGAAAIPLLLCSVAVVACAGRAPTASDPGGGGARTTRKPNAIGFAVRSTNERGLLERMSRGATEYGCLHARIQEQEDVRMLTADCGDEGVFTILQQKRIVLVACDAARKTEIGCRQLSARIARSAD